MSMKPTQIKQLQTKSKALEVKVLRPSHPGEPFQALVQSSSTLSHLVTVRFTRDGSIDASCTCAWAEHGGVGCSHVIAVLSKLAHLKQSSLSFWATQEEARRQKRRMFRLVGKQGEGLWITSRRPA
jgi:uncharacterized Zn finger protein